jgi:hypothetical protein
MAITNIENVRRITVDSDPTVAGALPTVCLPGDVVALNTTGTHYRMTGAGLVNEALLDASPVFDSLSLGAAPAAATSASSLVKVVTGIADNTATTVLTITVPNAAHGALVQVTIVGYAGASGAIGAFECVTGVTYNIAVARTPGVAMGATVSSAFGSAAAVVVGAGTMTCVGAITLTGEGVTATNTGVFKATIDASATAAAHRCMVYATILNSQASGITIA